MIDRRTSVPIAVPLLDAQVAHATPNHDAAGFAAPPEWVMGILEPLFIAGCGGDSARARSAAIGMVECYRARSHAELLDIVQIIAFGMAATECLRQSMAPELSFSMMLRLRGCANALIRSAQRNARALDNTRSAEPARHPAEPTLRFDTMPGFDPRNAAENAIQASIGRARGLADPPPPVPRSVAPLSAAGPLLVVSASVQTPPVDADAAARFRRPKPLQPRPQPQPSRHQLSGHQLSGRQPSQPIAQQTDIDECRNKLDWAAAMTNVAAELSVDRRSVTPAQRRSATMWAEVLRSNAGKLVGAASGGVPRFSGPAMQQITEPPGYRNPISR